MIEYLFGKRRWLPWLAVLAVAGFYAPGFGGFWHGDDVSNLGRAYTLAQQGTLWQESLRLFANPVPSDGAFYRPMMMLSLSLNYAFADANYAGWYLPNFLVHLTNTLLIALIVRRFAKYYACDATVAAPLAALLFGLCPILAEGVYWMSARADGWVTLLTLTGVFFWSDHKASTTSRSAFMLPLLLTLALGFKESAAVLPFQMALLAVAWRVPLSRPQRWAVIATFVMAGLFLAWRAYLFGNAWQVYAPVVGESIALHSKLWNALLSLEPWWSALSSATPALANAYLLFCAVGIALLILVRPVPQWPLVLALTGASGGLALATVLNLGGMSSLGEGGRLSYGTVAWLAVAIGVFMARPHSPKIISRRPIARSAATALFALALVAGSGVLYGHLRAAWTAQASLRAITLAVPAWAASHPGLTMLLVPDHDGAIVLARNAQGGLVLEPIQQAPYLHRVLPTLSSEVQLRQEQFCNGMAQRLEMVRPRLADARTMAAIAERADTVWPKHVACWSKSQQKIVPLQAPAMDASCAAWLASIRTGVENCER